MICIFPRKSIRDIRQIVSFKAWNHLYLLESSHYWELTYIFILFLFRADTCPSGEWNIDWQQSLRKYVKPEIASEVEKMVTALTQVLGWTSKECSTWPYFSKQEPYVLIICSEMHLLFPNWREERTLGPVIRMEYLHNLRFLKRKDFSPLMSSKYTLLILDNH